jgi:hypothetical protein
VLGSVPSLSSLWKSLRIVGISSSLKVWYYSAENPSDFSSWGESLLLPQFHFMLEICLGD